jgi:hypothetical protein
MRLLTVTRTLHGKAAVAYCTARRGRAVSQSMTCPVRPTPAFHFYTSYSINLAFTPHVALLGSGGSKIWDGDARPALSLSLGTSRACREASVRLSSTVAAGMARMTGSYFSLRYLGKVLFSHPHP